ncbi:hypothetical protein HK104_002040 [Borealophlyctis nickersoniae]|nr:hypothetical protein HK104_002040 [Borealophlyctis nickersoniae]
MSHFLQCTSDENNPRRWRCNKCRRKKSPEKKSIVTFDPATPVQRGGPPLSVSEPKPRARSKLIDGDGRQVASARKRKAGEDRVERDDVQGLKKRGVTRLKVVLSTKGKSKGAPPRSPEKEVVPELPFGGKLTQEEADISRCKPGASDKKRFARAKEQAKATEPSIPTPAPTEDTQEGDEDAMFYNPVVPKIAKIQFGAWEIDTWYAAPYPEEYNEQPILYLCEYCFKYMKSAYVLGRHKAKCPLTHPPGDEIYRDGIISIFEVDGRKNKIYCQNLCLLAKMFLDHKTLYYDVEPFLFYVMTENDDKGCHFVGYFSKEKRSSSDYNLSCIVTLPIHQRKGYGNLLIDFSYLLSKKEGKPGSPEKPLSDLGLLSYRNYWRTTILRALSEIEEDGVTIEDLSTRTALTVDDVVHTLALLQMLVKNAHGEYCIRMNQALISAHLAKLDAKGYPRIKPDNLRWSPFLFKRTALAEAHENKEPDASEEAEEESPDAVRAEIDVES